MDHAFEVVPQALPYAEVARFARNTCFLAEQMRKHPELPTSLDTINALYLGLPE